MHVRYQLCIYLQYWLKIYVVRTSSLSAMPFITFYYSENIYDLIPFMMTIKKQISSWMKQLFVLHCSYIAFSITPFSMPRRLIISVLVIIKTPVSLSLLFKLLLYDLEWCVLAKYPFKSLVFYWFDRLSCEIDKRVVCDD